MSPPYWQLTVAVSERISEGLTNFVWELGALGVVEDEVLRAFFPPDVAPRTLDARVREYLDGLRALGYAVDDAPPVVTPLPDGAWSEAWKEHFQPVEVGTRLLVAPPWNIPATSRLAIVIEPGRAFGTGHHGSTAGCLALLERLCEPGVRAERRRLGVRAGAGSSSGAASALRCEPQPEARRADESETARKRQRAVERALDLGTGSGILAIAAARLGIPEVLAVDNDPDAIAAAVANAARNGVPDRVRCVIADAAQVGADGFPLVVANLLSGAHLHLAARYRQLVAPGGALIVGGMLEAEADLVVDALGARGFSVDDRAVLDGWASVALRRS